MTATDDVLKTNGKSDKLFSDSPVAIVCDGGARTPFAKAPGKMANYGVLDLGQHVLIQLIEKMGLDAQQIDEVILGSVLFNPLDSNFSRHLVFLSGLPRTAYAATVSNNCISGLVAIDELAKDIAIGRADIGISGGVESMSNVPLPARPGAQAFWRNLATAKGIRAQICALGRFRPSYLLPAFPKPVEPFTGKTMGQHCEEMNREFSVPRGRQDAIALASHQNAARALADGILEEEITPIGGMTRDTGIREDTNIEALGRLPTTFDKSRHGTLTAGNSSFPTDGASVVCLMSAATARSQGRDVLAYVKGCEFAAIDPADGLLMAPALAVPRLLHRHGLTAADVDLFEIHEAFAAQVVANIHVWEHGWDKYPEIQPIGEVAYEKINVNGGSLAIGHPFAATGARLVYSLAKELNRRQLKRGVVSVCAAGAEGCAILLETP